MKKKLLSLLLGGVMGLSVGVLAGCDTITPEELNNYLKHGVDAPTEETGEIGTYYYETDEGNMWYRYEDKGWTIISNLKGEKGDKGDKGEDAENIEFTVEKDYNLLNMFVIIDNTVAEGYHQYDSGTFVDSFTGSINLVECVATVTKESLVLKWLQTDGENNVEVKYNFDVVDKTSVQPTYTYVSCEIILNNELVIDLTDETLNSVVDVVDVVTFDYVLRSGISSVQLVTQDGSFTAYVKIVDAVTSTPILITQVYGF